MASPKVFVSSTCFDLSEIREQLRRFIQVFGFEPVLSENGEVFYHPDLHTHEACVNEVSNCQLFILIIGGRFGGEYVYDKSKSITNAEYSAARESKIPIFTYIRNGVLNNHHIFQQNKKKKFVSDIHYPAIEKQEYALDIFNFIDEVRRAPLNNAIEGFNGFQDIESHLRKQWAGLFYELLKSREMKSQIDATNHLIEGLSSSGKKLEELVKSLYLSSNAPDAAKEIQSIDIYSYVIDFFEKAIAPQKGGNETFEIDNEKFDSETMAKVEPAPDELWYQYLTRLGIFKSEIVISEKYDEFFDEVITFQAGTKASRPIILPIHSNELKKLFENGIKQSTIEQRNKALEEIYFKYVDIPF
jgi:hypothetical protein